MAKSSSSSKGSGSSKSSSKSASSSGVSPARLHQKTGTAFGGYAKVAKADGSFTMKKTDK